MQTGKDHGNATPRASEITRGPQYPRSPNWLTFDRVVRFLLIVGVIITIVWLVWFFFALFLYLIIGIVLAYLLKPIVDRLQGFGIGRIPAIVTTFILTVGTVSLLLIYLVPFLSVQLSDLSRQFSLERAAQITTVEPGSTADVARIQTGEFIVAIDGEPWRGYSQLHSILRSKKPGETLVIVVENEEGNSRTAFLKIPATEEIESVQLNVLGNDENERIVQILGLTVREVALSDVAMFIEKRLRRLIPVEHGAIVGGITAAFEELFRGERISDTFGSVVNLFTNLFYAIIVIPFTAFFFLKDGGLIRRAALSLVPNRYFELTIAIIEKIESNIGRYFRALLLDCSSVAAVASILLSIVGLNYAVAVGLFAGLANIIPYFGPLMGFIAGTLVGVAQTGDLSLIPGVIIAMFLTRVADDVVFQPFYFSRAARAHPLVILFVVMIGAQLAGIIGMLAAIPFTVMIKVTLEQIVWSIRNYRILRTSP